MRVRAIDNHVTLVCADPRGSCPTCVATIPRTPASRWDAAIAIDRSGLVVADTGIRVGVAVALVDLHRVRDLYSITFHEDRSLFRDLVDPDLKPLVPGRGKRHVRVSIAQVFAEHGPNPDPHSAFDRSSTALIP